MKATKHMPIKDWLGIRKKAGRKINPETAELMWDHGYTLDPYGISPSLPKECRQIGRNYFARSPGSDAWVEFGDLPAATRDALWKKRSPDTEGDLLNDLDWLFSDEPEAEHIKDNALHITQTDDSA